MAENDLHTDEAQEFADDLTNAVNAWGNEPVEEEPGDGVYEGEDSFHKFEAHDPEISSLH